MVSDLAREASIVDGLPRVRMDQISEWWDNSFDDLLAGCVEQTTKKMKAKRHQEFARGDEREDFFEAFVHLAT
jgi:hypothetical protein